MKIALIVLVIALLIVVPVYAQQATVEPSPAAATSLETHPVAGVAEAEPQAGSGVTTLVLLIGLGAVALVGFGTLMRQNFRAPQDNP